MKNKNKVLYNDVLSESDFYPPSDDRIFQSYMKEMYKGEFAEYAEYIFDLYEEEDYWEN